MIVVRKPKLAIPNKPGLVLSKPAVILKKPKPKLAIVPKVSPADESKSVDEKTQAILDQIVEEAAFLDDDETRELWLDGVASFKDTGDIVALIDLTRYRRKVVPIDEFLFGKTYLGLNPEETYPGVLEACHALDTDTYREAVLKGALGGGKTTTGNTMLARSIYKLSCMRHPQSTFGIESRSSLVFTIQSIRINTAKKAVFEEFGTRIKHSPYFRDYYPYDHHITSQMIFREQNVTIMPVASSGTGAISMNVIGGILDEMNFMQKIVKSKSSNASDDGSFDQAKQVYEAISRRRKSRFAARGRLPGTLFLISSSRFPDDFTERRAAEAAMCGGTDSGIYVFSKSVWESKGRDKFLPEDFRVQIGTNAVRSKVLKADEEPMPGCEVILVPVDFKKDFDDDVDGSIRDFAGRTTLSTRPFITQREAIHRCQELGADHGFVNPFKFEQYDLSLGVPHPDARKLRTDISMFRAVHIDLGLTRDACGIAIGHVAGQKLIKRTDPVSGRDVSELMPEVALDVILRIVPPPGGEIEFARIRELLVLLRDVYHLPIEYVTMDGFQSIDSRQILRTLGFKVDYLSVEKVEPYRTLRDALYDGRVWLPNHQFVANELASLEYVPSHGKQPDKVDHRANGTKDVSDAVCGVTSFLLTRRVAWQGVIKSHEHARREGHGIGATPAEIMDPGRTRHITFRKSVFRKGTHRK